MTQRRQFLAQSTAVLAWGAVAASQAQTSQPTRSFSGYIDAHSHIWTPDTKRYPLGKWMKPADMEPASFTAEELMAIAQPCKVDRVVLIQHAPYYGDDNSYLIDCAKQSPGQFSIVAIVEERQKDLEHCLHQLKQQGVRGIRIGPNRYADRSLVAEPQKWLLATEMQQLWTLATKLELVICPLMSAEFLPTLEPMLTKFPETQVALDHFAHVKLDKPDEMELLLKLARFPLVHVKASGFYKFGDRQAPYDDLAPLVRQTFNAFGAERMLWGSDCPYQTQKGNNYANAISLIEQLDFLTPAARQAILRDNTNRLFFTAS